MQRLLLQTKLYAPPARGDLIARTRLVQMLDSAVGQGASASGGKCTLISAPAGFGKTSLVAEWLAHQDWPIAWLSLDEDDSQPRQFFDYLALAVQPIPGVGQSLSGLLRSAQAPPEKSLVTACLNDVTSASSPFLLILDDYHRIDSPEIDMALAFLLDHMPPQLHLILTSRQDPGFPLSRLRVQGHLTEIRAEDLRFTLAETSAFFREVMGLSLTPAQIAALEERTEGWIAGLQMAALSIQGRAEPDQFIQAFTGSHRFVLDYLAEEVLERQPDKVRTFLLQTSILDRLSGSLCDAVTGQEDSRSTLETLERGNLFVVPLDDQRQWYRYHHLFAQVLQAHVREVQPELVSTLHLRASKWYEEHDLRADAIRHALAAKDVERAAALIELSWRVMDRSFQEATWLGWARLLPDELIRTRPVLSAGYAWALLDTGELEAAEPRLRDAERWLEMAVAPTAATSGQPQESPSSANRAAPTMVVVDKREFQSLPATIAAARAYLAQALGDMVAAEQYAQRALELLPADDYFYRGIPAVIMGLAYWSSGELEAAHHSFIDAIATFQMAGNALFEISSLSVVAAITVAKGHLHKALATYQQALRRVTGQAEPMPLVAANLHRGIGEIYREWDDLEAAMEYLQRSEELGRQAGLAARPFRLSVAMALVKQNQGELDGALHLLDEAARHYERDRIPDLCPTAAMKARIWIRQGRLTEAVGWVRQQSLAFDDELSYLTEFEHITLARLRIAQFLSDPPEETIRQSMELIARLLQAAEDGGRAGSVIELLVLQALAHQARGAISDALAPLQRALKLAEPEGYIRIFVDEGPPMAALLREVTNGGSTSAFVHQLQASLETGQERAPAGQDLVEPLSEREAQILRLAAAGYKNKEIAAELVISLNTVLYHTKNLYGKLGVNKRTLAIIRAQELGLL